MHTHYRKQLSVPPLLLTPLYFSSEDGDQGDMADGTTGDVLRVETDGLDTPSAANFLDDDASATPVLMDKFQALSEQWSVTSSSSRRFRRDFEYETVSLMTKLDHLKYRWKKTPSPKHQDLYSASSFDSSSLGQTTLSSKDDHQLSVFERLYRNERSRSCRRHRRSQLDNPGTPKSSSLQRRLLYGDHVRNNWNSGGKSRFSASRSPSTPASMTDSVFERLYQRQPRKRLGNPRSSSKKSSSSVKSAPTVVRSAPMMKSSRVKRRAPSNASSTSPTSPMSGSDHPIFHPSPTISNCSEINMPQPSPTLQTPTEPRIAPRFEKDVQRKPQHTVITFNSQSLADLGTHTMKAPDNESAATSLGNGSQSPRKQRSLGRTVSALKSVIMPQRQSISPQQQMDLDQAKVADNKRRMKILEQQKAIDSIKRMQARSAALLQKHVRSYLVRRRAVTKIQSLWRRTTCARAVYRQALWCAPQFQRLLSNYLSGRSLLVASSTLHTIPRLQALARGFLVRHRYLRLQHSSRVIQCAWRRRKAALVIQRYWRAYLRSFVATLLVQRWWRMQHTRASYGMQRNAAIALQRCVQRWLKDRAVVRIQSMVRMNQAKRSFDRQYQSLLILQFSMRQFLARRRYDIDTIILVQSLWRRWLVQHHIIVAWHAALVVQGRWRGYRWARETEMRAASMIQLAWKKARVQRRVVNSAVLLLQRNSRRFLAQGRLSSNKNYTMSVTLVQRWWRVRCAVRSFHTRRNSMPSIQSKMRDSEKWQQHDGCVRIQSLVRSNQAKRDYSRKIQSIVCMQKTSRRYISRLRVLRAIESSCLLQASAVRGIQSQWRGRLCRLEFQTHLSHTTKVQAFMRHCLAVKMAKRARTLNAKHNRCALLIQKCYRGRQARLKFKVLSGAVLRVQSCIRSISAQQSYKNTILHVLHIQQAYRRHRARNLREILLREYNAQQLCALRIQTHWRMERARSDFLKHRIASLKLQANLRRWRSRKQYLFDSAERSRHDQCATLVQSVCKMRRDRRVFKLSISSSLIIQSAWRRYKSRSSFLLHVRSAIRLQCASRSFIQRCRAAKKQSSAKLIQAVWRQSAVRKKTSSIALASSLIQRNWRQSVGRSSLKQSVSMRNHSAIRIQKHIRTGLARRMLRVRSAAILRIQTFFRSISAQRAYQHTSLHVLHIQQAYRLHRARNLRKRRLREYNAQHLCALRIQAYWRMERARNDFLKRRIASLKLQASLRRWRSRKQYLFQSAERSRHNQFAVLVQSVCRMRRDRQVFKLSSSSSLIIQSAWRRYKSRSSFLLHVQSAIRVQCASRTFIQRCRATKKQSSAKLIQAVWRQSAFRKKTSSMVQASVLIQSRWRRFSCLKERNSVIERNDSALLLQTCYRSVLARRSFQKTVPLVLQIQRFYRRSQTRHLRENQLQQASAIRHLLQWNETQQLASLRIQTNWRMEVARKSLSKQKAAALKVQSNVRRWLTLRRSLIETRESKLSNGAVILQSLATTRREKGTTKLERSSCLVIQACWRRYVFRRSFLLLVRSATIVQRAARSSIQRLRATKKQSSAKTIQMIWRQAVSRQNTRSVALAARLIQRNWRRSTETRRLRQLASARNLSAMCIQKHTRMRIALLNFRVCCSALLRIQSFVRSISAQRAYRNTLLLVFLTQHAYRHHRIRNLRERQLREYNDAQLSSLRIQAHWRMKRARDEFLQYRSASLNLQASLRRWIARKKFLLDLATRKRNNSAVLLQSLCRMRRDRGVLELTYSSSLIIQAAWLRYKSRRSFLLLVRSAILVQRSLRSFIRRCRHRKLYSSVGTTSCSSALASTLIQRSCKRYLEAKRYKRIQSNLDQSALIIQTLYRRRVAESRYRQKLRSSSLIRRVFRNYIARTTCARDRKIMDNRLRAAACIQLAWRTRGRRSTFVLKRRSARELYSCGFHATRIQSCWRTRQGRKNLIELRALAKRDVYRKEVAAITIQRFWRDSVYLWKMGQLSSRLASVARCALSLKREFKAIRIQRFWRHWKPRLARRRRAVLRLEKCYTNWKIRHIFFRLDQTTKLLRRGVFGSLSRTITPYSLLQVNRLSRYSHFVLRSATRDQAWHWETSLSAARELVVTLIQACIRGYLCRLSQPMLTRVVSRGMPVKYVSGYKNDTPLLPVSEVVNDAVYRERVERKALSIVKAFAESEAEIVVNSLQRLSE